MSVGLGVLFLVLIHQNHVVLMFSNMFLSAMNKVKLIEADLDV